MFLRQKRLDRRTIIRGAINGSLVTLSLPLLEMMLNDNGTALAQGQEIPKRFVLFFFGAGVSNDFFPTAFGNTWQMTTPLQALAAHKAQINIMSNVSVPNRGLDPHATKYFMQLSGSSPRTEAHSYATLDQYIAEKISAKQTYKSVQLRISNSTDSDGIVERSDILSYQRIPGQTGLVPLPPEIDPAAAFNRIFGGVPDKREFMAKMLMINALKEDSKRLMSVVGKNDKYIIDEFLGRINDIGKVIDDKYNSTCDPNAIRVPAKVDVNSLDERMQLMSAITTHMFQCDLTRVVSILHSAPASSQIYPTIDPVNHHHELTHRSDAVKVSGISGIIMSHLGMLVSSLANAVEGDHKLLQQTLVYAISEETFPFHRFTRVPIIMIGGAGNTAFKTGYHVDAAASTPVRSALTALKALNIDPTDWSHDDTTITNKATGHYAELF
ncbi:MAG TPA: DUF1552 domain-containing protein [Oligoflexus sp.]|uniref:DUF1552 domain-containing protein n=1 Tax=Oligoflexus sp. TaxID=1971216 RepID=UPI002D59EEE7|nr:DUF1552 domain-containing protein [Oligoflexus sp.]HYX32919.1 DUF1552 domain-containing protein [Oligoflexus sp.]